jgi:hypothetical protein
MVPRTGFEPGTSAGLEGVMPASWSVPGTGGRTPSSARPRRRTGSVHRPVVATVGCQGSRSFELVGGKGFEPKRSPQGRTGLRPVSGPSARTALDFSHREDTPPPNGRREAHATARTTKKAFRGSAPEGLVPDEYRAFRALHPPYRARHCGGDRSRVRHRTVRPRGALARSGADTGAPAATGTARS